MKQLLMVLVSISLVGCGSFRSGKIRRVRVSSKVEVRKEVVVRSGIQEMDKVIRTLLETIRQDSSTNEVDNESLAAVQVKRQESPYVDENAKQTVLRMELNNKGRKAPCVKSGKRKGKLIQNQMSIRNGAAGVWPVLIFLFVAIGFVALMKFTSLTPLNMLVILLIVLLVLIIIGLLGIIGGLFDLIGL